MMVRGASQYFQDIFSMEILDLLKIIKEKINIIDVCSFVGGDYREIIAVINELIQQGAVTKQRGKLFLTESGLEMVDDLENELIDKSNEFHLPYKIEKIDPEDLYKPIKKKFLRALSRNVYNSSASSQSSGDSPESFKARQYHGS